MFFPVTGISSNDEYVRSEMQFTTLSQTRKVFFTTILKIKMCFLNLNYQAKTSILWPDNLTYTASYQPVSVLFCESLVFVYQWFEGRYIKN